MEDQYKNQSKNVEYVEYDIDIYRGNQNFDHETIQNNYDIENRDLYKYNFPNEDSIDLDCLFPDVMNKD